MNFKKNPLIGISQDFIEFWKEEQKKEEVSPFTLYSKYFAQIFLDGRKGNFWCFYESISGFLT